jgi:hypothetical protein
VLALALALGLLLPLLFASPQRHVDFLSDDAYYYFRVAMHLAAGDGPTFDGLTRTTGFHPLYAFVLAAGAWIFRLRETGLVVMSLALNTAAYLAAGWLLARAARRLWDHRTGTWAAILWLGNPHAVLLVVTGMEGSLYAMLLAALAERLATVATLNDQHGRWLGRTLLLGAVCGLCAVARTDGLLLVLLVGLWLLLVGHGNRIGRIARTAVFAAVAMIPFAAWVLCSIGEGGQFVQGSAGMKTLWRKELTAGAGVAGSLLFGARVFADWIGRSVIKVPLLKWTLPWLPRLWKPPFLGTGAASGWVLHGCWIVPVLLGLAYAMMLPKPWTWYYAPSLVLLTLLAAGGLKVWRESAITTRLQGFLVRAMPVLLTLTALESAGYLLARGAHGRNPYQRDMLRGAEWVSAHVPRGAVVGSWNAGIMSWYSAHTVVNLDGLINNEIIEVQKGVVSWPEYWQRRGITYLADWEEQLRYVPHRWPGGRLEQLVVLPGSSDRSRDVGVYSVVREGRASAPD